MVALYLDLSLALFLSGQLQYLLRTGPAEDPTALAERLATENYQRWCSVRPEISRIPANVPSSEPSTEK